MGKRLALITSVITLLPCSGLLAQEWGSLGSASTVVIEPSDSGFFVAARGGDVPSLHSNETWPIVPSYEVLFGLVETPVFFLTATVDAQRLAAGHGSGQTAQGAYLSFIQSTGLRAESADPTGWVIGNPDTLELVGVLEYLFPWTPYGDEGGFSEISPRIRDQIVSFVNSTQYHESSLFPDESPSFQVSAIGFQPIGDGNDILVTSFFFPYLAPAIGRVMVLRVDLDVGSPVVCKWISTHTGRFVPEFSFDVNDDGMGDFLFFSGPGDNQPSFILSGRDGKTLLEFHSDEIAVRHGSEGVVVSLANSVSLTTGDVGSGIRVFAASDGKNLREVTLAEDASRTDVSNSDADASTEIIDRLKEEPTSQSEITLYTTRLSRESYDSKAVRVVEPKPVAGWSLGLTRPPVGPFGSDDLQNVDVYLVYIPTKMKLWWESRWGSISSPH